MQTVFQNLSDLYLPSPDTGVIVGDCSEVLPKFPEGVVDVAFLDYPYNIGVEYDTYADQLSEEEYYAFLFGVLDECVRVLTARGALWVWLPPNIANRVAAYLQDRGLFPINDIIVVQRFGQNQRGKFVSGHVRLLYFAKSKERVWNPNRILVPSDRASKYADKRTQQSQTPGMRLPLDVWGMEEKYFGRVQGNNAERRELHPNQVPESVLFRALKVSTNPGDVVLDPFLGSGGSLTVARALECRGIGIEISKKYAQSAFERIQAGPVRKELIADSVMGSEEVPAVSIPPSNGRASQPRHGRP